jgi:D-aspartate ligase
MARRSAHGAAAPGRWRRRVPLAPASTTPPAVIVGGKANAVSVARSLLEAGVEVYALGDDSSPVRHSRACAVFADLGGGAQVQERWLEWLASRGPRGAVLLPCNDDALEMIARNRRQLTGLGYLPFEVNDEVALAMLDKARTYALARAIGVTSPRTLTIRGEADVAAVGERIGYPCALKPLHSHVFQRHAGARIKAFVVEDEDELRARVAEMRALQVEMLATEIVPGPDENIVGYYTYVAPDGELLFHFTKRKIRQYPVGFGTGSYHVTTWDPELVQAGTEFVQGVGIRGLANVEFKRHARTGRLILIECNHRFTAPTELLRRAGLDVAVFTYDRLVGAPPRPVRSYRTGVRLWHPVEDVRAFLQMRRSGDLTLGQWALSIARRNHTPMFRWRDPEPTFAEHLRRGTQFWARSRVPYDATVTPLTRDGRATEVHLEPDEQAA